LFRGAAEKIFIEAVGRIRIQSAIGTLFSGGNHEERDCHFCVIAGTVYRKNRNHDMEKRRLSADFPKIKQSNRGDFPIIPVKIFF
jgi:hypothetical protein